MTVISRPAMKSVAEVSAMIEDGQVLTLAGDEALLSKLPKGNWIGGSIPYFMAPAGGQISRDQIFVTELPVAAGDVSIHSYDVSHLHGLLEDAPEHGFSIIIVPAGSDVHVSYARNAPNYTDMFLKPIIGWVSGVHLDDLNRVSPKVFDGQQQRATDQHAVVLHAALPEHQLANIGIVNLFNQGDGDVITFAETGFSTSHAMINGSPQSLSEYLNGIKADTRLPLVADYNGAMMNVSFQSVDDDDVKFYAPVFEGVEYRLARPVADYVHDFEAAVPQLSKDVAFSCNCILNFLYSELEGKQTGVMTGPITFGEIAYQLLNQTLVYMVIEEY